MRLLDTVRPVAKRYEYDRMTGEQLSAALAQLGISMREFGKLVGAKPERVQAWLDGSDNIPQSAALAAVLLTLPGALELARTYTESVARDTRSPSA
jgi:hypothetical protein